MQRFPRYTNKIACLEGDWFGWDDNSSVRPVLEMLQTTTGAPFVYRRCNAKDEFKYDLEKVGRSPSFHLVYLAFHGSPGRIKTDLFEITLEELAERMGRRFKDRVIHFGACSTLRCDKERISAFLQATGAAMVTGFTVDVDWVESTAVTSQVSCSATGVFCFSTSVTEIPPFSLRLLVYGITTIW